MGACTLKIEQVSKNIVTIKHSTTHKTQTCREELLNNKRSDMKEERALRIKELRNVVIHTYRIKCKYEKIGNLREILIVVGKSKDFILSVCLQSYLYSMQRTCAALCCLLWPVHLYHNFQLHLINGTIFEQKTLTLKSASSFSLQICLKHFLL